jgi:hypothetical protein
MWPHLTAGMARMSTRCCLSIAVLLVAGCSSSNGTTADPSSTSAAPTSTAVAEPTRIPALNSAELAGPVTVLALPYPLPGTTGYQTAVAFEVQNPEDFAMVSPFRVTVSAGPQVLDATSGSDRVVLAPRQRLLVVNQPSDVEGTEPDTAAVTFYANEAVQLELPDPKGWQLENVTGPTCDTGLVGCEVNADLTYTGTVSQDAASNLAVSTVSVTFNRGDEVVLAGNLSVSSGGSGPVAPNQPVPVSGYVVGDPGDSSTDLELRYGVMVTPTLG